MIPIKIKIEYFIIAALVIFLLLERCGKENYTVSEKTTVEEEIITARDSVKDTQIKDRVPEKIQVIERPGKVEKVTDPSKLSPEDLSEVKQVNRYRDTTYFPGSMVISDIISEGRILEKNLVLEVEHVQTTITTEKTALKEISGFFFSPAISYAPGLGVENIEANITYINKGDFGVSAGAYYNTITNHSGFKLTIHKKIW